MWGQCGFVGDSRVRLVESLCGVGVGLSAVSVWAQCGSVRGFLCRVTVGQWEVPVWGECGALGWPCARPVWLCGRFQFGTLWVCWGSLSGSVWVCLGLCVGLLGALCWISVGMWEVPLWGQCGSDPLFEGDPPLLSFLHLTAGEGQVTLPICFLAVLSGSLLCHFSR